MIKTIKLNIPTKGNCDIVDITSKAASAVGESGFVDGVITLFNVGSTAGITTIEYEPGLVDHDIAAAFERIAPQNARYEHEETWHDDNGHSHVRASLLGPSLSVPFVAGELTLGTWQQIILVDFKTHSILITDIINCYFTWPIFFVLWLSYSGREIRNNGVGLRSATGLRTDPITLFIFYISIKLCVFDE